ncbi:MAG: O-antigen ligase family protein [Methylococcaceae bacterium]
MYNNKLHNTIIFVIVAVFYSYILSYAYNYSGFLVLTLGIALFLALIYQKSLNYIAGLPLYRWILFYLVVNLIWMILPHSHATPQNISDIAIAVVYIFSLTTLFYFDDNRLTIVRTTILVITLIGVFNHIYEFFNPEIFFSFDSKTKVVGRSSGLYGNSNGAAEVLILGMILSYGIVPQKFKALFLITVLLGIIPTFSRSGIVSWFLVVFILTATKVINKKIATTIALVVLFSVVIALPILISFIGFSLEEEAENILSRLDFFSSKSNTISDGSAQDRFLVARAAFDYFSDSPFFGAGHSFTYHWEYTISTHNIYLSLMAEYGLLGIFIYPLLVLSIIWKAQGEARQTGIAFATFLLVIGFVTHNVLEGFHTLLAIAAMSSWIYKSRTYSEELYLTKADLITMERKV